MKYTSTTAALTLLVSSACTTSMTSLQTARTMRPGQVQVTVGASVPVSSAAVGETIDAAELSRAGSGSSTGSTSA